MNQGKLVSDEYLEKKKAGEEFFKKNTNVSVMPRIKTPKPQQINIVNVAEPTAFEEVLKSEAGKSAIFDTLLDRQREIKSSLDVVSSNNKRKIRTLNGDIDELMSELERSDDVEYNKGLVEEITDLIKEKRERKYLLRKKETAFLIGLKFVLGDKEEKKNKQEPKGRAIDL